MKFSPKCRTQKLEMLYTILGSFCLFLNLERADYAKSGIGKSLRRRASCSRTQHIASSEVHQQSLDLKSSTLPLSYCPPHAIGGNFFTWADPAKRHLNGVCWRGPMIAHLY